MERQEYIKMSSVEDHMWWYRGLHTNLIVALQRHLSSTSRGALLDAGCGTGGLLRELRLAFPNLVLTGLDADGDACCYAKAKTGQRICEGSINSLPFADASFTAVVSADVLCHRGVDEPGALGEIHRCLVPQGIFAVSLPAYQWMYADHDRAVHTARRYTRSGLQTVLEAAGFVDIQTTSWNTVLFPLMVLRRKLLSGKETSDVMLYPKLIERVFLSVMRFENMLLKRGVTLPYGGSVLATALKA